VFLIHVSRPNFAAVRRQYILFLVLIGVLLPNVVGRLSGAWHWSTDLRRHQRLRPLWQALYHAAPEIALVPPAPALLDAIDPRNVPFRLYRRVIEIRDGQLAVRPYAHPAAYELATRLSRQAGLVDDALDATVEAAVLSTAIIAKAADRQCPPSCDLPPIPTRDHPHLVGEISWLTKVAHALHGSPIVATTIAQLQPVLPRG
jgi:hypothetical protein